MNSRTRSLNGMVLARYGTRRLFSIGKNFVYSRARRISQKCKSQLTVWSYNFYIDSPCCFNVFWSERGKGSSEDVCSLLSKTIKERDLAIQRDPRTFPLYVRFLFNKINPWTHQWCLMACTNMSDALLISVRQKNNTKAKSSLMKSLQLVILSLGWLTYEFKQSSDWHSENHDDARPVTLASWRFILITGKRFIWNQNSRLS